MDKTYGVKKVVDIEDRSNRGINESQVNRITCPYKRGRSPVPMKWKYHLIYTRVTHQHWRVLRRFGFYKFILVGGVLGFGVPSFHGIFLLPQLLSRNPWSGLDADLTMVSFNASICILAGITFGASMWAYHEFHYQKLRTRQKLEGKPI